MAAPFEKKSILVLGCGAVGLNTALRLQKDFPNARVTIMAEDLVSSGAAGIFRPTSSIRGPNAETTSMWTREAWHFYNDLKKSEPQSLTGIVDIPAYLLASESVPIPNVTPIEECGCIVRQCSKAELNLFLPEGKYVAGFFFQTIVVSPDHYLPWALAKFRLQQGTFLQKKIRSWDDLIGTDYDVVINCTGLAAAKLSNDPKMAPVRGHVIKVSAPWIKVAVCADNDTYVIPGVDNVTLGGCRQHEDHSKELAESDSKAIWQRATTLMPSLKKSRVVREDVGIWPHGSEVRVEVEVMRLKNGEHLSVVHHYGHCGYGVMVSPGTAITASKLAGKMLHQRRQEI